MPYLRPPGEAVIHFADVDFGVPGRARPRPVVLLHGLGCTLSIWNPVLAHLAADRRVVIPDLRGSGRSTPARLAGADGAGWTIADTAYDVSLLVDHLELGVVDVVGLSMGGTVALQLALDRPDSVGRLVTIGSFAGLPTAIRPQLDEEVARVSSETMRETAQRRMDVAFTPHADPVVKRWVVDMIAATDKHDYEAQIAATFGFNVKARLREVAATTTVVAGALDRTVPWTVSEEIAEGIAGSAFVLLNDDGHFVHLESTETFLAVLDDALAR
ncbi:MAG: alpha/beta fold hydrolase [Ilumatobacteraceae bacterium]